MQSTREGEIVGLPTLLAIYDARHDANAILQGLQRIGYPLEDVSVYYRPKGTDQVIDAATGQPAAGQALSQEELDRRKLEQVDTVVLMHPDREQLERVRQVLSEVGPAEIKYEGGTLAEAAPGGVERHQEPV